MTVKELIDLLSKENPNFEVCMYGYSIEKVENVNNEWVEIE